MWWLHLTGMRLPRRCYNGCIYTMDMDNSGLPQLILLLGNFTDSYIWTIFFSLTILKFLLQATCIALEGATRMWCASMMMVMMMMMCLDDYPEGYGGSSDGYGSGSGYGMEHGYGSNGYGSELWFKYNLHFFKELKKNKLWLKFFCESWIGVRGDIGALLWLFGWVVGRGILGVNKFLKRKHKSILQVSRKEQEKMKW